MSELVTFLPFIGIALIFWLLVIRPQSRRQRELARMQNSLEVGDRVMLTSGIHGTLRELGDETVSVEVSPGVAITVARGAIGKLTETGPAHHDEIDETDRADQADQTEEN